MLGHSRHVNDQGLKIEVVGIFIMLQKGEPSKSASYLNTSGGIRLTCKRLNEWDI